MSIAWHFNEARPGDRARESQVEKFFNSDAVTNRANAIVREGIQNSLDAAPDDVVVRVRIGLGRWNEQQKNARLERYTTGFFDHFDAEAVRTKIVNPPTPSDEMRYLVFEDFGTSGLLGDPAQCFLNEQHKPNAFFNYFRAEGISDKDQGNRGRHGVGKFVFLAASRARVVFGLTRRGDGRELLLGTTVLRNHWLNHKPYIADGWFGIPDPTQAGNTLPIEEQSDFIDRFKTDFQLSRLNESGLSVVAPWLIEEVTVTEVIAAVVRQYFHPILRRKLVVEVVDESGDLLLIDADTIKSVLETQNGELATVMQPFIALAEASFAVTDPMTLATPPPAPRWLAESLPDDVRTPLHTTLEQGELVALRVPMQIRLKEDGTTANSHFDISMRRDASINEGQILFIREGIIISDVRPRRTSGVRALVVIDEGPLATFLGDAENPSHTQWQKELVRDKYSYHAATIDYVVQSVPYILALLSEEQKKPDTSLLIDLFSLPADDVGPKIKEKRKKKKDGVDPDEPEIDVPVKPKSYVIEKLADGFKIRAGDPGASRPPMLTVRVAYGVRRGSPFSRYNTADFRLGLGGIECLCTGCELTDFADNWMQVDIADDDFEIDVTGFDTNRDLHIDAKVTEREVADAAASNYTGRKKINRTDAQIRIQRSADGLAFDADLHLADYKLEQIKPPPRVYVEAYRGASTLWKRFDFGRVGTTQAPADRSLDEFGVPEGILFRVKVSAEGDALGKLLAEADAIRPRLPDEQEGHGQPLIQHVAADDIGDELWRVTDFNGAMPLLKINSRVPMGVDQFLLDPRYRAVFAPAVMRQVLTRILVIDRDTGDEDDDTDWRQRWLKFAARLPGMNDDFEVAGQSNGNLDSVEDWIDRAVQSFATRAGLFARFAPQPLSPEGQP